MIQFCGRTDVCRRRQRNEDSILVGDGILVVCDGMGGHQAGDVASRIAVDTIAGFISRSGADPDLTWPYGFDSSLSFDANRIREGLELRVVSIPDSDLIKTARFVLAAKAQLQPERLQASLPTLIKIGPVERIRDLVNLNLPGIALRSLPVAPRQIPFHAEFLYFELDRGADLWKVTEQSRALAMHIAGEFPGLELEFWAVRGA